MSSSTHTGQARTTGDAVAVVYLFPNSGKWVNGDGRDITNFVTEVTIEEGLNQTSILATLTIRDGVNMLDDMRISGNEKIQIRIRQENPREGTQERELILFISDVINFSRKLQVQTYQFMCVSHMSYLNQLTVLKRPFKNSIGSEIKNILTNNLGFKDIHKDRLFINEHSSGGVINGIYPNLRPINAILWLKRNAFDIDTPFYFFESLHYEDGSGQKGGVVFESYKQFMWGCFAPLKFMHEPYDIPIGESLSTFEDSERRIRKISTDLGMSKFNQIPKGAFGSSFFGVDISNKTINKNTYNYNVGKLEALNEFPPYAKKEQGKFMDKSLDEYSGRRFFSSLNSKAFDDGKNYNSALDKPGSLQKSISIDQNLNYLQHEIEIEGTFNIWPGRIVNIKMPKATASEYLEGSNTVDDKILSGNFLTTNLIHTFANNRYIIKATCAKDSSMVDLDSSIL